MGFERNLCIDQWGRLKPKHSRFVEDSCDSSDWGHTCDCCGVGCTPELLANADPGTGVWRFEANRSLKDKLDMRSKKFRWLRKRFPKLLHRLEAQADTDEIYWFYDPWQYDKYPWLVAPGSRTVWRASMSGVPARRIDGRL